MKRRHDSRPKASHTARAATAEDSRRSDVAALVAFGLIAVVGLAAYVDHQQTTAFLRTVSAGAGDFVWRKEAPGASLLILGLASAAVLAATSRPYVIALLPIPARAAVRRALTVLSVLGVCLALGIGCVTDRRAAAVADAEGVTWYAHGRETAAAKWSQAEGVFTLCSAQETRTGDGALPPHSVYYRVAFPGRKTVNFDEQTLDARWPDRVAPVDDALRAAGVARLSKVEESCVQQLHRSTGADPAALRRLLAP